MNFLLILIVKKYVSHAHTFTMLRFICIVIS